ncbi:MAG: deoxyribodipyrimidine photo-lyase [Alphaproteobacteria bacterium]|nr:deoxyribodipyrimidine photo-lyase [Alphaproteobacteria bacterium]
MSHSPLIVWLRQDLRLSDNPALSEAVKTGVPIIPVYILDDVHAGEWKMGGASRVWLHHSLSSLNTSLNGKLQVATGPADRVLTDLIALTGAKGVYWNRCYEPWRVTRDTQIKKMLETAGTETKSFNGSLLWEPWDVLKDDGTPYRVFTPFFRKGCLSKAEPRTPIPAPVSISFYSDKDTRATIDSLNLRPRKPAWDQDMTPWDIGETAAQKRLHAFLETGLKNYKEGRNIPAGHNVSRLSPHIHFGEISPHQSWHAAKQFGIAHGLEKDLDHFLSELGWREFSHSLLYNFPTLPRKNFQPRFDSFPWQDNAEYLTHWQQGQTGYPIVDAGMRELYQTGYMHNRVRMIVGSFLVKNLLLHWHHGEDWFWDTLYDADLANNSASWQWIAGSGADAAPYFRIFNPVTQGEKFDPEGTYVRQYVPELASLPMKYLHQPWEAPPLVLSAAGITLGKNYPHPLVDHSKARDIALKAFEQTKNPT